MHYTFKSTPTIAFQPKTQIITKANQLSMIPGPGYYSVKKSLPNPGNIAPTKQKRQLFKNLSETPGPGAYQQKSYTTSGIKRSMSAKTIRRHTQTPGPDKYQIDLIGIKSKSPSFSLGRRSISLKRILQKRNRFMPGPGTYQYEKNFIKNTGSFFGQSQRKQLTQTQQTPAPTYYNVNTDSKFLTGGLIGSQKKQMKIKFVEVTPGPAAYTSKGFVEKNNQIKKGFSFREKVKDLITERLSQNPAPGQYNSQILNIKQTAPRFVLKKSPRKTFIDEIEQLGKKNPSFSKIQQISNKNQIQRPISSVIFGKSKRKDLDEFERTPGPMAYESDKLKILKTQPSFSCSKDKKRNSFLLTANPQNPGPGNYDSLIPKSQGKIIILKSERMSEDKARQTPGVGQYDIGKKKQGAKFSFSKEKRQLFGKKLKETQGSDFYEISQNIINPPSYLNVKSKINLSPTKSRLSSTGF